MNVKIDDELIASVAALAKLELSQEEKEKAKKDMEQMLKYMDVLKKADTRDAEPLRHIFPQCNVFREDEVVCQNEAERILGNAPELKNRAFVVPVTIGPADGG